MAWYDVVSSICREIRQDPPGINNGMRAAIDRLATGRVQAAAAALRRIEWGREEARFQRWIARSAAVSPIPAEVAGLWFEVPEIEINPAALSFVGSRSFDDRAAKGDWACEAWWTQNERRAKKAHHSVVFPSSVLRDLQRSLKVGPRTMQEPRELERLAPLSGGLPLIYMQLLLRRALSRVLPGLLGTRSWRGVGFGYASGDLHIAGVLTPNGWVKPGARYRHEHVERATPTNSDPELDLNSDRFNPRKYFRAGLDLDARDKDGETPLARVMSDFKPDFRLARAMIDRGASIDVVNSSKATPLLMLLDGPASLLKLLLSKGADPNAKNLIDHAPMHASVGSGGRAELVRLLLEHGGDPNLRGMFRRTPLHAVADYGHPSYFKNKQTARIIDLLVGHGADLEAKDGAGATPLMHAVIRFAEYVHSDSDTSRGGHDDVAIMLLAAGANPNCRIRRSPHPLIPDKGTPLMCRRYNRTRLHLALLRHGADVRAKSSRGLTALDYAKKALRSKKTKNMQEVERLVAAMERA